jgi:taurine dioxygenase
MSLQGKTGTARQITAHPLVRVHPVTGRRSLFISPDYCEQLEDMTLEESRPLLDFLERHATRNEFTCRFRWEPRSIAVWDNRCTMHNALEDDLGARLSGRGFKRVMRRATIKV